MVATAAGATAFGQGDAPAVPAILPLIVGSVVVSELMSAYVLFAEFARSRLVWLPFVAAAYLLTALLTIPYVLAFPGIFAPNGLLGASAQTALQLWILWHLTFPAAIVSAIVVGRLPRDVTLQHTSVPAVITIVISACVGIACVAPFLIEGASGYLPELIHGRTFTATTTGAVLPIILLADLLALFMLYTRTSSQTAITPWLFIALVASALDAFMGVASSRYSYGWYVGKIFLLLSSSVMLVAFIGETGRLRARLGRANEDLRRIRERERHLAQERVHQLAHYDENTGLANRTNLEQRLRSLSARPQPGSRFTVIFLSLDRFKEVNDRYGHGKADQVLRAIADRLAGAVRRDDMVARFSGDEFVVLAPLLQSPDDAEKLAEALRAAVGIPLAVEEASVRVTASVGIAMFPDDGTSAETVLDNADAAAREAKRAGGDRTLSYSREFFEEARARRRLHEDLGQALARDEFVLYYQPILDLRTGEVAKVEALIRWMHPERGMVPPDAFIPLAEQTGMMQLIGYWVVEEAVRQASSWKTSGTPTRIAVNVSARQLDDSGFVDHLTRTFEESGLPSHLIELEITESAAMSDATLAQDVLEQCRSLGLHVSLDDFGTYYSSLTYLKRLPIDSVKIDRSFIQGLPFVKSDAAIVSGILGLARALERTAVAEGIETEQQRAWLTKAGCEFGQGYLFGRPMPPAAFLTWQSIRSGAAGASRRRTGAE